MEDFNKSYDSDAVETIKQQIKEKIMPCSAAGNGDSQKKLNDITERVGEIKQQIRQVAASDAKMAKDLLAKMNSLEKMMDDVFPDLIDEIQGVKSRLEGLNADFFSNIFSGVLRQEFNDFKRSQSLEVKERVDASL